MARPSVITRRHFLVAVTMLGFLFVLRACFGPAPGSSLLFVPQQTFESDDEFGEPQASAADDEHHPPRVLLQAQAPLQADDDRDDETHFKTSTTPSQDTTATATPSPPTNENDLSGGGGSSQDQENKNVEQEAVEDEEKAKILGQLRRRGWQNQLEVTRALDILKRADELLTQAGRDYFLTDGSLLGYCRHAGGFTPWDDDMDIMTSRANIDWLLSPEGREAIVKHGLELKTLGSGKYHKLFLPGEDIPRAGECSWGYPFLDVFPYDLNETTGLIEVHGSKPKPPQVFLPPRRVQFHSSIPQGLLVPSQPGLLLDMLFKGWRTDCRMEGWNHRLEDGDDSLDGKCEDFAKLLSVKLAPRERCPSPSMHSS